MAKQRPLEFLLTYRHELFLASCFVIVTLTASAPSIESVNLTYVLFLSNLLAAILLFIGNRRWAMVVGASVLVIGLGITLPFRSYEPVWVQTMRPIIFAIFYAVVTFQITNDVWREEQRPSQALAGLMSGFIALGVSGFFVFLTIWSIDPAAFSNVSAPESSALFYFSFVTILSLGFGDIVPSSEFARRSTIVVGLLGQFYLVIVMAVALNRFTNRKETET